MRDSRWIPLPSPRVTLVAIVFTSLLISVVFGAQSLEAQTFSVLYTFQGQPDGAEPFANVIVDAAGSLYGTTYVGGTAGLGTVFKVDSTGTEIILRNFTKHTTGEHPTTGVIRDAKGNLYGAAGGGPLDHENGIIFELTSCGTEKVLYDFRGGDFGADPNGSLVRDSSGNFYGTTGGGIENCGARGGGCGTFFKLDASGSLSELFDFPGGADGGQPLAGVIRDSAGNLYGTTSEGGNLSGGYNEVCAAEGGCGVVFKIDATGEKVLYTFTGEADGGGPQVVGLVRDAAGNLYGTTSWGGNPAFCGGGGCGVVFELHPSGVLTVLHKFTGSPDGEMPYAGLVRDSSGNLYGTTLGGGSSDCSNGFCGTVFKLDKHGNETILHAFSGGEDGSGPYAALVLDKDGNLYGTTAFGGTGYGVVFKIAP